MPLISYSLISINLYDQGSADRPYNNEIVIISPNEAKSLSKGLLNLGNITKVVSNRGKAKM